MHDELAGDAWLVGRVTGQEFAKGKPYPASTKERFRASPGSRGATPRPMAWCSTPTARSAGAVRTSAAIRSWSSLSETVSDAHLAGLRSEGVSYIFAGKSELDLALALDILNRELGVKRLLLEGGGGANGAFLRAGLVDELNLILCPAVDGAKGHRASSIPRKPKPTSAPPSPR